MSSVDVVVPCYNYGHFLRECVRSVLSQTGVETRVLILDDASTDHTAEVASELTQEDPRVTFIRHLTNRGHIATYNEGIDWISGDYYLLLSADDYLLPGALDRATSLMDAHPEVGFTFGSAIELFDGGVETQVTPIPALLRGASLILTGRSFIELSGCHNIVPTPSAVVRTSLQKCVGGYRPELPHAGDMEMWFRLASQASVGVLEPCQAVQRKHANNMSRGYFDKYWLGDLHQRRAALDVFFNEYGANLADAEALREKLFRSLATEAIGWSSAAFNDESTKTCNELSQFAFRVYPAIYRSLPWMKLALKRCIGSAAWRWLQPAITTLNRLKSQYIS